MNKNKIINFSKSVNVTTTNNKKLERNKQKIIKNDLIKSKLFKEFISTL